MYEFIKEFAVRIVIVVVVFLFLIQICKIAGKIFHSALFQSFLRLCAGGIEKFASCGSWCGKLVAIIAWFASMVKIAFKGFHAIEDDDSLEDVGKKIRANYLRGLVYDVADYQLAILCAVMVSQLKSWGWNFSQIFLAAWIFDIACCAVAIVGCLKVKQDLTLGEAHRRGFEAVNAESKVAGWIYKFIQHPMATIWDGPEQLVFFYKKELQGFVKIASLVVFLTLFQGAFWAWTYSLGHDSVTGLISSVF